jgi:hypothetical protein
MVRGDDQPAFARHPFDALDGQVKGELTGEPVKGFAAIQRDDLVSHAPGLVVAEHGIEHRAQ